MSIVLAPLLTALEKKAYYTLNKIAVLLKDCSKIVTIKRLDMQQTKTKPKKKIPRNQNKTKQYQNQNKQLLNNDFGFFYITLCCYPLEIVTY